MSELKLSTFNVGDSVVVVNHGNGWFVNETGVYSGVEADSENLVCSSIWVDSVITNTDTGMTKICIKGISRLTKDEFEVVVDYANLIPTMNNPIFKEMGNRGFYMKQGGSKAVLDYLSDQEPRKVYGVNKIGWYHHQNSKIFVTPHQIYGAQGDTAYCYAPDHTSPSQKAIRVSGTLAFWQQQVVSACVGNPVAVFALGAAFAAPLMSLFNVDGGGFHFWGHSSRGKTTILQIASSVWGNAADPAQQPGLSFIQRWNTTANALEGTALAYNDLLLPMDELGTSNIKNFGQAIYQLSGGVGKSSLTANRDMRISRTWKTLIISSGEHAIAHEVEATTGLEARSGQLIRFIDICVEGNIFPAFANNEAAQKVTELKDACSQHFGAAGDVFVQYLVRLANLPELMRPWQERFDLVENALVSNFTGLQPEQKRAIKRFALVAIGLMLATEAKVISMTEKDVIESVMHVFGLWLTETPSVSEADRGVEHLKQFIFRNPNRFASANDPEPKGSNLIGYQDRKTYLILKEVMPEVVGRSNYKPIVKKLDEMGMLLKNNTNNDGSPRPTYKMTLANNKQVDVC